MPPKKLGSLAPSGETLRAAIVESGILDPTGPFALTYRDLARTQTILHLMLHATIDAIAETDEQADTLITNSEMARHVFALSRVLHAMANGQKADQLIRPGGRRYDHPAGREVIGICVEALDLLQQMSGLSKKAASETIADVLKQVSRSLNLDHWDVSPRTIREDWPTKAPQGSRNQMLRFAVFANRDREPNTKDLLGLLIGLLAGPMWVLAEHQEFNPPTEK